MALKYKEKELEGSVAALICLHSTIQWESFPLSPIHMSCPRQTLFMLHPSSVFVYGWRTWPFFLYLFLDVLKYMCTLSHIHQIMLRIFLILSVSKTMRQTTLIICGNGILSWIPASQLLWNGHGGFDMENYIQSESIFGVFIGTE